MFGLINLLPRHSLHKPFSKVVEGNGDLHVLVLFVRVAVAQQHDLVMMGHVIVRNGDGRGSMNGINQPIIAIRQRAMIHPNVAASKYRHPITVRYSPPTVMARGVPHISIPSSLAIMYVNPMNYNVGHVLYSNAWPAGNVNFGASAVDGLERVHEQFFLQFDHHVTCENDPQRFILDNSMPKSARFGVDRVTVTGVGHHIYFPIPATNGMLTEPNGTIG